MLPSRSRLQSWNPEALIPAAVSVRSAGETMYAAVRRLDDEINRMDETKGWFGQAHTAATGMFDRATVRSSRFLDYTTAVADVLRSGSATLGTARSDLLRAADQIDTSALSITDGWVVLLKPAEMSAEQAAQLQEHAEAAQAKVNKLLLAVGRADSGTSDLLLAAKAIVADEIQPNYSPGTVLPTPADEVPNPRTDEGKQVQEAIRVQDMATTIRERADTEDEYGNQITTLTMLDGSQQVFTEYSGPVGYLANPYEKGTVKVVHTDKNGDVVSTTMTYPPGDDGVTKTTVLWSDDTTLTISETAGGTRTCGVITADGTEGVIPADVFLSGPLPLLAGGALSGLEAQADRNIPRLSPQELQKISAGAKFGGPAIAFASMVYDMASAETLHDVCVASWKGTSAAAGGAVVAAAVLPVGGPIGALVGNVGGALIFGHVGEVVGNLVCPR